MVNGQIKGTILPQPSETVRRLLGLAKVQLPRKIKCKLIQAATKPNLQNTGQHIPNEHLILIQLSVEKGGSAVTSSQRSQRAKVPARPLL